MIAGLIPTDAGEILFDGKPLRDIKFGYVFQNYREALFPWLRSIDNIEYPLKLMKLAEGRAARAHRAAGRPSRRQDRPQPLPLRALGRPAAADLDHARARGRAGNPVPRRAVLGARLRDDAVHARPAAAHLRRDRHHHGAGLARSRGGGLSRRPHPAAVAPAGARSPTTCTTTRRGRAPTRPCRKPSSCASRRIASRCSSARCARDDTHPLRPLPADHRRDRPDRDLVHRGVVPGGRSGAAAVADRHLPRAVERHGRRPARLRFLAHGGAHHPGDPDRRGDRHPARHLPRLVREALSLGRVRGRLLPLDAGLRDVSAVPGAVRGRRQDQDLGRGVRRRAGDPVQRRLRRDERAQDAPARRQGDGRVAACACSPT